MAKTTDFVLHRRHILESCWNVFNIPSCSEYCCPCLSTPHCPNNNCGITGKQDRRLSLEVAWSFPQPHHRPGEERYTFLPPSVRGLLLVFKPGLTTPDFACLIEGVWCCETRNPQWPQDRSLMMRTNAPKRCVRQWAINVLENYVKCLAFPVMLY